MLISQHLLFEYLSLCVRVFEHIFTCLELSCFCLKDGVEILGNE